MAEPQDRLATRGKDSGHTVLGIG